ncbi:MAG TPA: hypothetical protein PLO37_10035 [Candidatus Hydrogenedentes bacterium]|nr:hypothetical protein [Candidatus Hydrogenedentota bacterium]HPG67172.1 hypothetical protein [Candidatus Hydrogenedentota bacterium]
MSVVFRLSVLTAVAVLEAAPVFAERLAFEGAGLDLAADAQRLSNTGFEQADNDLAEEWAFWADGYDRIADAGRNGGAAVRCVSNDAEAQHGARQVVRLDQTVPRILVARGWSRAEGVDGSSNTGYAIYLDITYADGDHLWGETADFRTGTHDWEQRQCVVMPSKPIRELTAHVLFRGHTGMVWFDDVELFELTDRMMLFEGVPVSGLGEAPEIRAITTLRTEDGLTLDLDANTGFIDSLAVNGRPIGGGAPCLFVRDAAAESDFVVPDAWAAQEGEEVAIGGALPSMEARLAARFTARADRIELAGEICDERGEDRAVTVYVAVPVQGEDWLWCEDARRAEPACGLMVNAQATGAGATGTCSPYPLAALAGPRGGIAIATPLDDPRHQRLGYDAHTGLLFAAFDLGLSPDAAKSPGRATFRVLFYTFGPEWQFRAALERYYALFPDAFEKRVPCEGLWMAFTDISAVEDPADFGFAFHEGTNNVPWDEANGVLSFVYTEPMTQWLALPKEVERSHAGVVGYLDALRGCDDPAERDMAALVDGSAVRDAAGNHVLGVHDTPWCDGCVFALNPDPDIPKDVNGRNRGSDEYARLTDTVSASGPRGLSAWAVHGSGYVTDANVRHGGAQSIRVALDAPGGQAGARQRVTLAQTTPAPLVLRAWIRTEKLTGDANNDCSVYVDLEHSDGTPLFGQTIPIPAGSAEFHLVERTIQSDKAFAGASVHLLMRGNHTGSVWFDDVYLGEEGLEVNLIENSGLEGALASSEEVDGVYIDSYEFWATTIDYDRRHFAGADLPLVFDTHTHEVGILTVFATFEFEREMARRMRADGKFMMANGVLYRFGFPAAWLDVLGTETNWFHGGSWQPASDSNLCFYRALCYQKPYCFLLNTHYADLDLDDIERYMRRAVFYGMFPGFFSEDASTNCFFENPDWYNAARPLFKQYVPLARRLAAAGWEPITHGRSGDDRVYVERYGRAEDGTIYFATCNETDAAVETTVRVALGALGWNDRDVAVYCVEDGDAVDVTREGSEVHFPVRLEPDGLLIVALTARGQV